MLNDLVLIFSIGERAMVKTCGNDQRVSVPPHLSHHLGQRVTVTSIAIPLYGCCEYHGLFCAYEVQARDGSRFSVDESLLRKCDRPDQVTSIDVRPRTSSAYRSLEGSADIIAFSDYHRQ